MAQITSNGITIPSHDKNWRQASFQTHSQLSLLSIWLKILKYTSYFNISSLGTKQADNFRALKSHLVIYHIYIIRGSAVQYIIITKYYKNAVNLSRMAFIERNYHNTSARV